MVVKNLTSKKQKVEVREFSGEHRIYDIFLEPESSTSLDNHLVVINPEKYSGIFEFGECCCCQPTPVVEEKKEESIPVVEEPTPVVEEAPAEESTEEEPTEFICDICGAEFASARGLSSHKNKAHAE